MGHTLEKISKIRDEFKFDMAPTNKNKDKNTNNIATD